MRPLLLALLAALLLLPPAAAAQGAPKLVPRGLLLGNPERLSPRLSPDGRHLAYIAPDARGVLQVFLRGRAQPLTADPGRGVRTFHFAHDGRTLLYLQDQGGDENFHLYAVDLAQPGPARELTPLPGVRAELVGLSPQRPDEVLVALNQRDRARMDVHRLQLRSGALRLDTQNPGDVVAWFADGLLRVRLARAIRPDGSVELRARDGEGAQAPWRLLRRGGADETLECYGLREDGRAAYLQSSLGSDTARVVQAPLLGEEPERVLAASAASDVVDVLLHPRTRAVQAAAFLQGGRPRWTLIDDDLGADFAALGRLAEGDVQIVSRDLADARWIVAYSSDRAPLRYFTYQRRGHRGEPLFSAMPALAPYQAALAPMRPVVIRSRDGLALPSFLTLPSRAAPGPGPLVLLVHGGPWGRDAWGFVPTVQWLQDRGYAVLQVNFRGSGGYGKAFLHAGDRQWGRKMHDDLLDALAWAVKEGVADPRRAAIYGTSYGGYAVLAALSLTPEVFACGVDIVGPSNIESLLRNIPPYWAPLRALHRLRVGDIDDPAEQLRLRAVSPLHQAGRIVRPLLIGQGHNDPRVPRSESEQIVAAVRRHGGQVSYVVYPDEGHGFQRPHNRLDFAARAESFLQGCLGGRAQPPPP